MFNLSRKYNSSKSYEPNNMTSKYKKPKVTAPKGETDKSTQLEFWSHLSHWLIEQADK